jgi:ATP-dependent DNA ligase
MVSRSAKDCTGNFSGIAAALATLPVESAWLDGEVVVMASDGRTSFQALQGLREDKKPIDVVGEHAAETADVGVERNAVKEVGALPLVGRIL